MTTHITQLTEALQRHTLALFFGADLPSEVTGLPARSDLARELARRQGLDETLPLAEVAQRVSQAGNRWAFTDFVRQALDTSGKSPQAFHERVASLVKEFQIETVITTAYDNLLEAAFQGAGMGINRVVRGSSWYNVAQYCRSAFRYYYGPGDRYNNVGFRLARSVAFGS